MSDELTEQEVQEALKIAGELIDAGIPVFAAAPDGMKPGHYVLPRFWQNTKPGDRTALDKWQPGYALGAVGGFAGDWLDIDPRSGGRESEKEIRLAGQFPRSFGQQDTPSGGAHHLISATGERKSTGFMPGLDLQSGGPLDHNGTAGRGFVYISPTVRPSKAPETLGELRPYRWVQAPDTSLLADFAGSDDSTEGLIDRVHAARSRRTTETATAPVMDDPFSPFGTVSQVNGAAPRVFTDEQARAHVLPFIERVQQAKVGEIEERANALAAVLSHFVPSHFTVEVGMTLINNALGHTAYDPHGPSDWTSEKFRAVLDGRRPPSDAWTAVKAVSLSPTEALEAAQPALDEVSALMAEMLTPAEVMARAPMQYLVKGLLNLDSESWIIGAAGSKKSFVALDIAGHVAAGRAWQGLKVRQSGVVIIAAEGAGGLRGRMTAYELQHGPWTGELRVLPRPVQAGDAARWAVLTEVCRRLQPGLIVVDTQARVTVGLKENDATDMGFYVAAVNALKQATGACVLTIHHTGRQGGDARGSSAIDGAQDTELKVKSTGALSGELHTEKQKDLEQRAPMTLTFARHVVGVDEDGEDLTSLALTAFDGFNAADGKQPEAPEEWEIGHALAIVQLFKVLRDQGGQTGLTKAEARASMIERFYGNEPARLKKSTYYTAWSRGQEKRSTEDEPVMINVSGEKWCVDTEALKMLSNQTV